ncbi:NADH dehydrogenase [ubiquinone] 1 beta subcomplex subunit 11, mitochondrial isoform X2 [Python bivittatus]|uniref:NADH dehydrogenase [ubiquinone] 1 beta subcomplex subunit 11, mitochondrial isoform X2 n=1 Tax=Python bivittatus TaxID=176946 RepID=A0A9F5IE10_PYTBI|nr:NADH dehydrogenase [ubiquinone] 1 beta subcomplex subunit 11, mitochondrial isoform X2 [Python bivittatus]
MAALRRVAGLQRLLGLPVRAVSSGRTANSTVSARIPPASRPLEVVEWHPMEKEKEKSPFVKDLCTVHSWRDGKISAMAIML